MRCYWQPPVGIDRERCLDTLHQISPWLENVHMFYWNKHDRLPLEDGAEDWIEYLKVIGKLQGERFCMLEFVKDGSAEQFLRDAETLKRILSVVSNA